MMHQTNTSTREGQCVPENGSLPSGIPGGLPRARRQPRWETDLTRLPVEMGIDDLAARRADGVREIRL